MTKDEEDERGWVDVEFEEGVWLTFRVDTVAQAHARIDWLTKEDDLTAEEEAKYRARIAEWPARARVVGRCYLVTERGVRHNVLLHPDGEMSSWPELQIRPEVDARIRRAITWKEANVPSVDTVRLASGFLDDEAGDTLPESAPPMPTPPPPPEKFSSEAKFANGMAAISYQAVVRRLTALLDERPGLTGAEALEHVKTMLADAEAEVRRQDALKKNG